MVYYIDIKGKEFPVKMGLNTQFRYRSLTGEVIDFGELVKDKEKLITLFYCMLHVGCRVEGREVPADSLFDFVELIDGEDGLHERFEEVLMEATKAEIKKKKREVAAREEKQSKAGSAL